MPTAHSVSCTGCGAPLPIAPVPQTLECPYCHRVQLVSPEAPRQAPPPFVPQPPVYPSLPTANPALKIVPIVMAISLLMAAGISVSVFRAASVPSAPAPLAGLLDGPTDGSGPGSGGVVPPGEHLQWWSSGVTVLPVRWNDDAAEDFVGMYRLFDTASGAQTLHVGLFEGAKFERKWAAGPYGGLSEGATASHFAVAGRKVFVTDFRHIGHILDLQTGQELGSVTFTDKARSVCSQGREVWVEVADQQDVLVDVEARQAKRAKRPAWCPEKPEDECQASRALCLDGDAAPKVNGFYAALVLKDGGAGVAIGRKSPGTPVPMALGLSPDGKSVKWQATIAPDPTTAQPSSDAPVELQRGRLFTTYELTGSKGAHLTALEAETGRRLYDVKIPRSESGSDPDVMIVSDTRIYVPHWTWLDVFDAADGRHIATVGMW
jgi:hypothetical protein